VSEQDFRLCRLKQIRAAFVFCIRVRLSPTRSLKALRFFGAFAPFLLLLFFSYFCSFQVE
jgi:hypothetical protein